MWEVVVGALACWRPWSPAFYPRRGRWLLAEMHPGNQPFANLARALLDSTLLGKSWTDHEDASSFLTATLRRGPLGLVELVRETGLPERTNLLVFVDQFEEIFRFRRHEDPSEATAFVNLLLDSGHQADMPIYVVITMRSDFLGDCAVFAGLPEALNAGQFLTPRLTRTQCRAAIVGPVAEFEAEVEPALISRILNDIGTDPDQLPLMQHVLMRVWTLTLEAEGAPEAAATPEAAAAIESTIACQTTGPILLAASTYGAVGGLANALSQHADLAYQELPAQDRRVAEVLFRCLSDQSTVAATRGDRLHCNRSPRSPGLPPISSRHRGDVPPIGSVLLDAAAQRRARARDNPGHQSREFDSPVENIERMGRRRVRIGRHVSPPRGYRPFMASGSCGVVEYARPGKRRGVAATRASHHGLGRTLWGPV